MKRKTPSSKKEWLEEIVEAFIDAAEAEPFGKILETEINAQNLYLLAPLVCIKFRNLKHSKKNISKAQEAAFASVIATEEESGELHPALKFSLAYITSHLGLEKIGFENLEETMDYLNNNIDEMINRIVLSLNDPLNF